MPPQAAATMALTLAGSPQRTLGLLDLPSEAWGCVAEQLEKGDRIRLAAACRTLRAASVDWFRGEVFCLYGFSPKRTAEHVAWLGRVHAQVDLRVNGEREMRLISTLASAGARIVKLSLFSLGLPEDQQLQQLPAEVAGLAHLRHLFLALSCIQGGWQSLPPQLRWLDLRGCGLQQLPAALAGLTQLSRLDLSHNDIAGGWESLTPQLQQLDLQCCGMQQLPAALAGLAQLTELRLSVNAVEGGWRYLPPRLQRLKLDACGLQQVPAELAGLTQLTHLALSSNPIDGGWEHLPRQLQLLRMWACALEQLPAALAGLTQLTQLSLSATLIDGGWQNLPPCLQQLNLCARSYLRVPAEAEALLKIEWVEHGFWEGSDSEDEESVSGED